MATEAQNARLGTFMYGFLNFYCNEQLIFIGTWPVFLSNFSGIIERVALFNVWLIR